MVIDDSFRMIDLDVGCPIWDEMSPISPASYKRFNTLPLRFTGKKKQQAYDFVYQHLDLLFQFLLPFAHSGQGIEPLWERDLKLKLFIYAQTLKIYRYST